MNEHDKHDNHFVEPEELQAWLDSELEPARQRAVTTHVAECYECATLAEDLKRVSVTLQQWDVEDAPASLHPPVVEELRRPWVSLPRWRPIFAFAGAAAVVLIIAAVSIPNLMRSRLSVEHAEKEMAKAQEENQTAYTYIPPDDQAVPVESGDSARAKVPPPATAPGKKPRRVIAKLESEDVTIDGASSGVIGGVAGDQIAGRQPPAKTITGALSTPDTKEFRKRAAAEEMATPVDTLAANQPPDADATLRDDVEINGRLEGESKAATGAGAPARASEPAAPQSGAGAFEQEGFALRRKLKQAADLERRMLAYQVNLGLEVKDFHAARRKVESLVTESGGYMQDSRTSLQHNQKQQASYHLRVPTDNLQVVLEELRALGQVTRENMTTEELTDQLVDIDARQRNSRNTEERLLTLQKIAEMDMKQSLAVEREITRVRSEIERREAQRLAMLGRAAMASIHLELLEEFTAEIEGAGMGFFRQIRNAAVEGYNGFTGMLLAFATLLARWELHLVFWLLLGKLLWRFWLRGFARTFQLNQL